MLRRLTSRISTALAVLILAFVAWQWWASLLPSSYTAVDMGYPDFGGGEQFAHGGADAADHWHGDIAHTAAHSRLPASPAPVAPVDVSDLTGAVAGPVDVSLNLTATKQTTTLAGGTEYDGYALNGSTPGPTISAVVGDLVEVRFRNDNVPDGATLHWHGVDVPNASDGVAGVTQDAVREGEEFTYRFVVDEVGSYWYHSHQVSHEQVKQGLFGGLVVYPDRAAQRAARRGDDVMALVHTYSGVRTVNGHDDDVRVAAEPGDRVRVRLVNTDNNPMSIWVPEQPFRVLATDGHEINEPGEVEDVSVEIGAGARADVEVVVPPGGARIQIGETSILLGQGEPPEEDQPEESFDFTSYGKPSEEDADLRDAAQNDSFDRDFSYDIGRRPGFLDGKPGLWWSINGHLYPDVPMFMVQEGDLVRMTISNHSGEVHPMHLHGHRVTVLSKDGEPVTGSPWSVDSLDVEHGESYEVAFVADNPGVWMDHCHNLPHAKDGMVAHLMYEGVTSGFEMGEDPENFPE